MFFLVRFLRSAWSKDYNSDSKLLPISEYVAFLASRNFCRLLVTFANSLDPEQDWQNVGFDLDPTLIVFHKEKIEKKASRGQKHGKITQLIWVHHVHSIGNSNCLRNWNLLNIFSNVLSTDLYALVVVFWKIIWYIDRWIMKEGMVQIK